MNFFNIKKVFFIAAIFLISDLKINSQDASGFLPDEIFLRTMTQSHCKYFDFTIVDGRIYAKKPSEKKWRLFLKTGLPYSKMNTTGLDEFPIPERVAEISANKRLLLRQS